MDTILLAVNPETLPEKLVELWKKNEFYSGISIRSLVAANPNTPTEFLIEAAKSYPENFLQNSVLDFLLLEDPLFFKFLPVDTLVILLKTPTISLLLAEIILKQFISGRYDERLFNRLDINRLLQAFLTTEHLAEIWNKVTEKYSLLIEGLNCCFDNILGIELRNITFKNVLFKNTVIAAQFINCTFDQVYFDNCSFGGDTLFKSCKVYDKQGAKHNLSFNVCHLELVHFVDCYLKKTLYRLCDLGYAKWNNCKLIQSEFAYCDSRFNVVIADCDLSSVFFKYSNLRLGYKEFTGNYVSKQPPNLGYGSPAFVDRLLKGAFVPTGDRLGAG